MLSDVMRELRKNFNITQGELADALHVSHGTVSMWEINKRNPDLETLCRIADYFNVSADYLLGRSSNGGMIVSNGDNCAVSGASANVTVHETKPQEAESMESEFFQLYRQLKLRDKAKLITEVCSLLEEEKEE